MLTMQQELFGHTYFTIFQYTGTMMHVCYTILRISSNKMKHIFLNNEIFDIKKEI